VALVQRATGAPLTSNWKAGELVRGNTNLPPGTAIALFDANGKYGNHTDGSSHAAIYMGQDSTGINIVEQYNIRDADGKISTQISPHSYHLSFNTTAKSPIRHGENYRVIR
jgi:hypothetical protein